MLTHVINSPSSLELNKDGRVPKLWTTRVHDNFPRSRAGISVTRYMLRKPVAGFCYSAPKPLFSSMTKREKPLRKNTPKEQIAIKITPTTLPGDSDKT